jgi:uncharacterized protein YcfL
MKSLLPLCGLAVLFFTACSSGPTIPVADPKNPEISGYPVVLLDSDLRRTLAMDTPPVASRTPSGQLSFQVGLRNRTSAENLQVQVQTIFRAANGLALYTQTGSETPWQNLTITPGQTAIYSQTSLTPEAQSFTVRVRYTAQY